MKVWSNMTEYTIDQALDYIKDSYLEVTENILQHAKDYKPNKPSYVCPICGNGTGRKGTGITFNPNAKNKGTLKCFSCGENGDIIHFIAKANNLDEKQDFKKVLEIIGEDMGFSIVNAKPKKPIKKAYKTLATYQYKNKDGKLVYEKIRQAIVNADTGEIIDGKNFTQKTSTGSRSLKTLSDQEKGLLYNQDLIETWKNEEDYIYLVEGEKDADTLTGLGLKATTTNNDNIYLDNANGIKKLIIIPDNDTVGYEKAKKNYLKLKEVIPDIKVFKWDKDTPQKYDSTDVISNRGFSKSQFIEFIYSNLKDDIEEIEEEIKERKDEEETEYINGVKVTKSIFNDNNLAKYTKARDIAVLNGVNFYYADLEDRCYIDYGNNEILDIETQDFTTKIISLCEKAYIESNKVFTDKDIKTALGSIRAYVTNKGERKRLSLRYANSDDRKTIYIDRCSKESDVIKIDANGVKLIPMSECPIIFKRNKGMAELPKPIYIKGESKHQLLYKYFLNNNPDDFKALIGFLIGAMCPIFNQPLLSVTGEAGSGKTTLVTMLSELIDPYDRGSRKTNQVVNVKGRLDSNEFAVLKSNRYLLPIDNLSGINGELSDTISMAVTGGTVEVRKMYTNSEVVTMILDGVVILNGINDSVKKSDLADRCVFLTLPTIPPTSRQEQSIWSSFEKDKPYILGDLYQAISTGLKNAEIEVPRPKQDYRLAGFREFVARCSEHLGWTMEKWNRAIINNKKEAIDRNIEENPFMNDILSLILQKSKDYNIINWIGNGQDLLNDIFCVTGNEVDKQDIAYPRKSKVSARLLQEAPTLRQYGIEVITGNDNLRTMEKRYIHLRYRSYEANEVKDQEALIYTKFSYPMGSGIYENRGANISTPEENKFKKKISKVFFNAYGKYPTLEKCYSFYELSEIEEAREEEQQREQKAIAYN